MEWQISPEKFLTKEQVQKLTEVMCNAKDLALYRGRSIATVKDHYIVQTFLLTGLRLSELISLQVEDLYLKRMQPCLIVQHGKGDRKRSVFLSQDGKNILLEYLNLRLELGEPATGTLFLSTHRKPYTPRAIQKRLKLWYRASGLDYRSYGCHSLRHSYLTELLRTTKNLNLVKNQAGHSSLNVTSRYLHLVTDDLQQLGKLYS